MYASLYSWTFDLSYVPSSLHKHLVEHLNAEIVLHTISDVNVALDWIRSTFLYIRALKNPSYYGEHVGLLADSTHLHALSIHMEQMHINMCCFPHFTTIYVKVSRQAWTELELKQDCKVYNNP